MAANTTLLTASRLWATAVDGSVGTTWREFQLSTFKHSSKVTIKADAAIYLASSEDGAADDGAVGATCSSWTAAQAGGGIEVSLYPDPNKRISSVFVAAQSGTAAVQVVQE